MKLSLLLLTLPAAHHGWVLNTNTLNTPSPVLNRFTQETTKKPADIGTVLDIKLDVGKNDRASDRMSVNGMMLELLPDNLSKSEMKSYPGLPGSSGPNPKSSTGAKHLTIQQEPFFIDMTGTHKVRLEQGCWEVVWREGASAGSLIVGFHHPQEDRRNDATLPKGRIYMSFPVWTVETLADIQEEKNASDKRGKEHLANKADAMDKYISESNIFKKGMHYLKALDAAERYSLTGSPVLKNVPNVKTDTIVLQDDLLLSKNGKVFTKNEGFFAGPDHIQLGTATVSRVLAEEMSSNDDVKVEGLRP